MGVARDRSAENGLGQPVKMRLEMLKTGMIMGAIALSLAIAAALTGVVGPFSGHHALDPAWTSQPPLAQQAEQGDIIPVSAPNDATASDGAD